MCRAEGRVPAVAPAEMLQLSTFPSIHLTAQFVVPAGSAACGCAVSDPSILKRSHSAPVIRPEHLAFLLGLLCCSDCCCQPGCRDRVRRALPPEWLFLAQSTDRLPQPKSSFPVLQLGVSSYIRDFVGVAPPMLKAPAELNWQLQEGGQALQQSDKHWLRC